MLKETEWLGKKVSFIRFLADPKTGKVAPREGVGIVTKVYLSEDQRIQFGVMVGQQTFGIDYPAINPTEEGKARYCAHLADIYKISDDVNAVTRKMSEDANAQISALNTAYLGARIELEAIEEDKPQEPVNGSQPH